MSFFVFLLYDFSAAVKIVSNVVEEVLLVAVGGIWDITAIAE